MLWCADLMTVVGEPGAMASRLRWVVIGYSSTSNVLARLVLTTIIFMSVLFVTFSAHQTTNTSSSTMTQKSKNHQRSSRKA
jgi:hypothetical protein